MTNIAEVIGWKHNHQEGMTCQENSDGVLEIVEFPGGIPSVEDQKKWSDEYEAHVTANAYKEKRKEQYGSWESQLDEMYHNFDDWKKRIQKIKQDIPKG